MLESTNFLHLWVLVGGVIFAGLAVWAIAATWLSRDFTIVPKVALTVLALIPVLGLTAWLVAWLTRRKVDAAA